MDNLRQLLVAIAALTLLFSAVSGANPNYFVGYSAFADHGEEEEDDISDTSGEEEHDDSDRYEESDDIEHTVEATLGTNTSIKLKIDDEVEDEGENAGSVEAELEIETKDGGLPNGEHVVLFNCTTPDVDKTFDAKLVVTDGDGDFEGELMLVNGTTYKGCEVAIGDTDVALPEFTVNAGADDDDEKERNDSARRDDDDEDDEDDDDGERAGEHDHKAGLRVDDGEVKIKVEKDTTMADGTYEVHFTCTDPAIDMTLEDSLKVEDGEAKFEAEFELADGSYSMCKITAGGEVLATFDSFAVAAEEEDDDDVEEKRKEKRREIISTIRTEDEHKRRMNANPASTGDFEPGWNYTLTAIGSAAPIVGDEELIESISNTTEAAESTANTTEAAVADAASVEVNADMAVWKSNKALILLSVHGGTVEVNDQTYNIELGYALYSVNHNVMRLGAFVSDDAGNIYKLKLRGYAEGEGAAFPTGPGESIEMEFEGNAGPARNTFSNWQLMLAGTIETE